MTIANLMGVDLTGADLEGADLEWAKLDGAKLKGAQGLVALAPVPETGSFIAWKKLKNGAVAKLRIPDDAARTGSYVGTKCRAERVEVLEGDGTSIYDPSVTYSPGRILEVQDFNPDHRVECAPGLHFFMTEQEAQNYIF